MVIRSLPGLDIELAWRRTLWWARRRLEVPDRLPFEVLERVAGGRPEITKTPHLRPVERVFSTKGSGTARPFVRLAPADLTLYQALVDPLAPSIESALRDRESIFAYRQSLEPTDNPFEGSPSWDDFVLAVRRDAQGGAYSHAVKADITSYFLYVSVDELERRLFAAGADPDVVRDLAELLRAWRALGVQGLPQGVQASSPLGNFYLHSLDDLLAGEGFVSRRYMDDFWLFADSFSEARRAQDVVERHLYELGLTIGGEKSRILRTSTVLEETQTAKERIERRREQIVEEVLEDVDAYTGETPALDPDTLDVVTVQTEYQELISEINRGVFPPEARPRLNELYRQLEALKQPEAISAVPDVLQLFPDLTGPAMRYVANTASVGKTEAVTAFLAVLEDGRFHREQELLLILRAVLWLPNEISFPLAAAAETLTGDGRTPLLRARALLAWGAQSDPNDFESADSFWLTADNEWRMYCLVSIQDKTKKERDERYDRWSGEGRFLRQLADEIKAGPFGWRKL